MGTVSALTMLIFVSFNIILSDQFVPLDKAATFDKASFVYISPYGNESLSASRRSSISSDHLKCLLKRRRQVSVAHSPRPCLSSSISFHIMSIMRRHSHIKLLRLFLIFTSYSLLHFLLPVTLSRCLCPVVKTLSLKPTSTTCLHMGSFMWM